MPSETPLVSVIVPAYNAERYIAETIRSVIDQTFQAWELIIVNDGSTDKTEEIIAAFSDNRIMVKTQRNSGVSVARNTGLEMAQGKYITFLDADDVLPARSLEARAQYLQMHPEIHVVDGKILVKDRHLKKTLRRYEPYYRGKLLPRLLALDSKVFFSVCYMFRREMLGAIRFNEHMTHAEDLLFYMMLSNENDANYAYVNEAVYWYRSGHASAMANLDGLEAGYLRLIKETRTLKNARFHCRLALRVRITKIMILGWINNKEFIKALRAVKVFWFA